MPTYKFVRETPSASGYYVARSPTFPFQPVRIRISEHAGVLLLELGKKYEYPVRGKYYDNWEWAWIGPIETIEDKCPQCGAPSPGHRPECMRY